MGAQSGESGRSGGPSIAIVGLGPVGVAIGRALTRVRTDYSIAVHDRDAGRVKAALRADAADRGHWNLAKIAEQADLIFLAEPFEQQIETIGIIAQHMRVGSLVVGVSSRMAPLVATGEAAMPSGVSFIATNIVPARAWETYTGGDAAAASDRDARTAADASQDAGTADDSNRDAITVPDAGRDALAAADRGRDERASDEVDFKRERRGGPLADKLAGPLFGPLAGATWCLAPSRNASDEAVRVLRQLAAAVGAEVLFIDVDEHDSLVAGASRLPRIAYAALARVIARSPSALDLRRLVDPSLRELLGTPDQEAAPTADESGDPVMLLWLDQLLTELTGIREALAAGDDKTLRRLFDEADEVRASWSASPPHERGVDVSAELRDVGGARQFLFGRWRKRPVDERAE